MRLVTMAIGIATRIYALLTELDPPHESELQTTKADPLYGVRFQRNLKGGDFVHWGDGDLRIPTVGIAPEDVLGSDYKLYLAPQFVETKNAFIDIKHLSRRIGDARTFNGFILKLSQMSTSLIHDSNGVVRSLQQVY